MSRRLTIVLITGFVLTVGAAVCGAGLYFFVYPEYQAEQVLKLAEENFADGDYARAAEQYQWYAARNPQRVDILEKHMESSRRIIKNRRRALAQLGNAYLTLVRHRPEVFGEALEFLYENELWGNLETLITANFPDPSSRSASHSYLLAVAAERLGRPSEALEGYQSLLNADPPNYDGLMDEDQIPRDVYLGAARLLHSRQLVNNAERLFTESEVPERHWNDPLYKVQHASFLILTGDLDGAKAKMDEAFAGTAPEKLGYDAHIAATQLQINLASPPSITAEDSVNTEALEAAAVLARQAVELDPDRPQAYVVLAYTYANTGRVDEAIELLAGLDQALLATYPKLYVLRAELELQQRDPEAAIETVETLRGVAPEGQTRYDYIVARRDILEGDFGEAAESLNQITLADPSFSEAYKYLVVAYLGLSLNPEAGQSGTEAGVQTPEAYFGLAQAAMESYLNRNSGDEAMRRQQQNIFGNGFNGGRAYACIWVANESRDNSGAVQYALNLLNLGAQQEASRENTFTNAEAFIRRLTELDPANAEYCGLLVQALAAQGRIEDARAELAEGKRLAANGGGFELAEAAIALAQEDRNAALELRDATAADEDFAAQDARHWAYLFARHDALDAGLETLDKAASRESGEARARITLDQVRIAAEFGALDRALTLFRRLESEPESSRGTAESLLREKIALTKRLVNRNEASEGESDYRTASKLVEEMEQDAPGNPEVQFLRGQLHLLADPPQMKAAEDAIAGLNAPGNDPALRASALAMLHDIERRKGNYTAAAEYVTEANRLLPADPAIMMARAQTLVLNRQYTEARTQVEQLLERNPKNLDAMALRVRILAHLNLLPQARDALDTLSRDAREMGEFEAYEVRIDALAGLLHTRRRDYAAAEQKLRASYAQAPDSFQILRELATAVFRQRGSENAAGQDKALEAIELIQKFADTHEADPRPPTMIGDLYTWLAREAENVNTERSYLIEAHPAYSRAQIVDAQFIPAIMGLIDTNTKLGNTGDAIGLLNRWLEQDGDSERGRQSSPDAYFRKAAITAQDRTMLGEALEYLDAGIAIYEEESLKAPKRYKVARAMVKMQLGYFEEAISDLRNVVRESGGDATTHTSMAAGYLEILKRDLEDGTLTEESRSKLVGDARAQIRQARNMLATSDSLNKELDDMVERIDEIEALDLSQTRGSAIN